MYTNSIVKTLDSCHASFPSATCMLSVLDYKKTHV